MGGPGAIAPPPFNPALAAYDCGTENQTAELVMPHCPHGITGLVHLYDDTITWLHESCPDI